MKKSLITILTLVFVLSIANFAAANPFNDVPANHWAYSAVEKLTNAGIVAGMGNGRYEGNRAMTRFEMAEITAKALAKADKADAENKALIDKLAAEFAAELNNLGVRVSALEEKVGTVKITGDVAVRYENYYGKNQAMQNLGAATGNSWNTSVNLYLNAKVNDNTEFNGWLKVQDYNMFGQNEASPNSESYIAEANLVTNNVFSTGADLTMGRFSQKFGMIGYFMDSDGMVDGAKIKFGSGAARFTLGIARFGAGDPGPGLYYNGQAIFGEIAGDISKNISANIMFLNNKSIDNGFGAFNLIHNVWGVGLKAKLSDDFSLSGEYFVNNSAVARELPLIARNPKYWGVRLSYKEVDPQICGSYGAFVEYRKSDFGIISTALTGSDAPIFFGVKGWAAGAEYAMAKNVILKGYYTFNDNATVVPGYMDNDLGHYARVEVKYLF